MGADDANDGPGECPGHKWWPVLSGWHLQPGTLRLMREYACPHCGAVALFGPGEYVEP